MSVFRSSKRKTHEQQVLTIYFQDFTARNLPAIALDNILSFLELVQSTTDGCAFVFLHHHALAQMLYAGWHQGTFYGTRGISV